MKVLLWDFLKTSHNPDEKLAHGILSLHLPDPKCTPLKINMEPKNGGLEDDFPFQLSDFLGGDFKYVYFHPYLGKIPITTNHFLGSSR